MKKRLSSAILAMAMVFCLIGAALAADPAADPNKATLPNGIMLEKAASGKEWTVVGYSSDAGDTAKDLEIEIPALYENLPITKIEKMEGGNSVNIFGDNRDILKSLKIPGTVKEVASNAFAECASLNTVIFLDYVEGKNIQRQTTIKSGAFMGCDWITTLVLSSNIVGIEDNAFKNCSRLAGVTIPEGVRNLGNTAFTGCTTLEDVTILDRAVTIGQAFTFNENCTVHCISGSPAYNSAVYLYKKNNWDLAHIHCITSVTTEVIQEATCTSKGQIKVSFTCPAVTKEIAGDADTPAQTVKIPCSYYTKENGEVAANVTIDKDGNATYTITHETSIIPHAEVAIPATPPCIDKPFTEGIKCANCQEILKAPEPLPADQKTAHTFDPADEGEETIIKEATCTEAGESGVAKVCTVCQQKAPVPDSVKPIPATGHQYYGEDGNPLPGKPETIRSATCTENGFEVTYSVCTVCGAKLTCGDCADLAKAVADAADAASLENAIKTYQAHLDAQHKTLSIINNMPHFPATYRELPKTGHTMPSSVKPTVITPPTCTEPGEEMWPPYQCTTCKEWIDGGTGEIPALGGDHDWTETEVTKPATCTEAGKSVPKCSICGALDETKETDIPALGHEVDETAETTTIVEDESWPATCTKKGQTTLKGVCTRSDELHGNGPREDVIVKKEIEMIPHTPETPVDEIPATCTTPGKKITHPTKCSVCGAEISGEEKEEIIPALGHEWGNFVPDDPDADMTQAEDCTEKTIKGTVSCTRGCGVPSEERTIVIPGKMGHTWGPWVTTKEPTDTEDGEQTRTCEVCKKTETKTLPKGSTSPEDPDDPDDPDNPDPPDKPDQPDPNTDYTITLSQGTGGSAALSRTTAKAGDSVTITVTPQSGYELDMIRIIAGGTSVVNYANQGGGRYRFTMPAASVSVTVSFSPTDTGSGWGGSSGISGADTPHTQIPVPTQITSPSSVPRAGAWNQLFSDIPTSHWAAGEIGWANQMGYMSGSNGRFNPDGTITAQQTWMVLARFMGTYPANMTEARLWAARSGFASGGDPTAPMTRHQVVTALYRCAALRGRSTQTGNLTLAGYTDSSLVPAVARNAMIWAVSNGIIAGDSNGRLNPTAPVTRAQFAVILYRFSQRV